MSSLLPFLYQTRTLQRLSRAALTTPEFRALMHSDRKRRPPPRPRIPGDARSGGPSIPFELPAEYDNPDEAPRVGKVVGPGGVRSTITPTEQEVFGRIFDEIATRHAVPAPAGPSPAHGTTGPNIVRDTVKVIMQDAVDSHTGAPRQLHSGFDPLHPLQEAAVSADWEKILLRFPPKLRASAFQALIAVEGGQASRSTQARHLTSDPKAVDDIKDALEPLSGSMQDEVLRAPLRTRIQKKMVRCKTDHDLWYVLETDVFPLVAQFGIAQGQGHDNLSPADGEPQEAKLPLHIYGPLYPSLLHTALRLFNREFASLSPYAMQILPRIKELGPASYVLGVSTPFFNELANIMWLRLGNPGPVFDLLEEMRAAGLSFDNNTAGLIGSISKFVEDAEAGKSGPFMREIMSLPEFKHGLKPRVKHWRWATKESIRERSMTELAQEGPPMPVAGEMGFM
ncbi:hypothetical protein C8A05DRAFT_18926 [Staphylotrichum tortipilum]|uniref:Mtf2-like C-terminal domain-containing protein n=1 Tax=Staphylotrichum tortipilum TaxID=2831512 RepID=A0AAN6ME53_9PEZI|nr:hypothetical protein C8A05DRAFT_18926 [Staphylotrichum longicolle]